MNGRSGHDAAFRDVVTRAGVVDLRSVSATGGRAVQPLMPVMHIKGKDTPPHVLIRVHRLWRLMVLSTTETSAAGLKQ